MERGCACLHEREPCGPLWGQYRGFYLTTLSARLSGVRARSVLEELSTGCLSHCRSPRWVSTQATEAISSTIISTPTASATRSPLHAHVHTRRTTMPHVEQKNWTVVRRLVGYDRDSTKAAYGRLQEVHRLSSLYTNFLSAGHEAEPAWCQGTQGVQHRQDTLPAANGAWCPVRRGARDPRSKVPDSKSRSAQGPTRRRPRGPVDHRRSTPRTPPLGNTFI